MVVTANLMTCRYVATAANTGSCRETYTSQCPLGRVRPTFQAQHGELQGKTKVQPSHLDSLMRYSRYR